MEIITRPIYLERIISRLDRKMMLILIGQRRVGKSYMLRQLQEWLRENAEGANIVYVNKELQAFSHITTSDQLYEYASDRLPEGDATTC